MTVSTVAVLGIMYRLDQDGITRHLVLEDAETEVVLGRTAYTSQDGYRCFPLAHGPSGIRLCPDCRAFVQARLDVKRAATHTAAIVAASYEAGFGGF